MNAALDVFSSQANVNRLMQYGPHAAMAAAFTNYWNKINWQGGRENMDQHVFTYHDHDIPCVGINSYFEQRERTDMVNRVIRFLFTCPSLMWSFGGMTTFLALIRMNPLAMVIGNIIGVSGLILNNILLPKMTHTPIKFKACLLSSGSMILGTLAGLASLFYVSSIAPVLTLLGVIMIIYSAKSSLNDRDNIPLIPYSVEASMAERIIQNHPELLEASHA